MRQNNPEHEQCEVLVELLSVTVVRIFQAAAQRNSIMNIQAHSLQRQLQQQRHNHRSSCDSHRDINNLHTATPAADACSALLAKYFDVATDFQPEIPKVQWPKCISGKRFQLPFRFSRATYRFLVFDTSTVKYFRYVVLRT